MKKRDTFLCITKNLQKVQAIFQLIVWNTMHVVGHQEAQFGRVLEHGWYFRCTAPIEIQVSLLVCPNLKTIRRQIGCIMYDVVIGWRNRALSR